MTGAADNIVRSLTPADGAALLAGDLDEGQTGLMVPTGRGWAPGVTNLSTANFARFIRFRAPRDLTPIFVAFSLTVAATNNDAVEVWITDKDGVKLFTTGSVAALLNGAVGIKTPAFVSPVALRAGSVYYAALTNAYAGATAAQIATAAFQDAGTRNLYGASLGAVRFGVQSTVTPGSSPSTLVPDASPASAQMPLMVLRES